MIFKIISIVWLVFCLTSENKYKNVEKISVVHMAIAFYVAWALFFDSWTLPGVWGNLGLTVDLLWLEVVGWFLFFASIVFGVAFYSECQNQYNYQYPSLSSWVFRHRQVGYFIALLGCWLIAYTGGYYQIPMFYVIVAFIISSECHPIREKSSQNKSPRLSG